MNLLQKIRIVALLSVWFIGPSLFAATEKAAYDILETKDHDASLYTQGLIMNGDDLVESSGLYGKSKIVRYNADTGDVIHSADLPYSIFAEGIHQLDNSVFLLTWQKRCAYRLDAETFAIQETFEITNQGWGLTHDGQHFIQSDGSSVLFFRNSSTFAVEKTLIVHQGRTRIPKLNELEMARGFVWANVYMSPIILAIDPESGQVVFVLDLSELNARHRDADPGHVLNGIAYDPERDAFWVTGKCWNKRYLIDIKLPNNTTD